LEEQDEAVVKALEEALKRNSISSNGHTAAL
jgi:hypothetical protein